MPANAPQQAMYIRGGDVKFMRSMPMNADILIGPVDSSKREQTFVFDLYHYRDQVSAGYFNFDESGAMAIRMPSYTGPASGALLGNAAARLNDSFLAAQQNALRDVRQHWEAYALAADAMRPGMQTRTRRPWRMPAGAASTASRYWRNPAEVKKSDPTKNVSPSARVPTASA